MTQNVIFIQVHERPGVIEAQLIEAATFGDVRKAIEAVGVVLEAETHIFLDEAEEPLHGVIEVIEEFVAVEALAHECCDCRCHCTQTRRIIDEVAA